MSDPYVKCIVCGKDKAPRGRSLPLPMCGHMCDSDCPGYDQEPLPSSMFPGEMDRYEEEGEPMTYEGWARDASGYPL